MNAEILALAYGSENIEFRLLRRDRKTLSISVKPDLSTEVVAPVDVPLERIFEKVRKRAPWIRKQKRFFAQFHPRTPQRRFVSGETHLYLGRQYKLKVVRHIEERVKLYRGLLLVQSYAPKDTTRTQGLVENWYRERAHIKFRERLSLCQQRFPHPDRHMPAGLIIRQLKQRWGSMTVNGNLILNQWLVRSSVDAIDYVVTHELCHMRHDNHGPDFYRLLDRLMPDWKNRKLKLERQLA
jgi:predicted metal-dependent hydrolase